MPEKEHAEHHSASRYINIWWVLVGLLIISVLGPMAEIKWLTLITAFGIALIKATMVCAYYMHLNVEKRYIWYLLLTVVVFMLILFSGLAPDIMRDEGTNWKNMGSKNFEKEMAHIQEHEHGGEH